MPPKQITDERKLANISAAEQKLVEKGHTENARMLASILCGACLAQTRKPITYQDHIVSNIRTWLSRFPQVSPPQFRHLTIDHISDETIIDIYDIVALE